MLKKFVLFFILYSFSIIYAQKTSIEDVLLTAFNDERVQSNATTKIFAEDLNYRLPLLRKVDVRFGINGNATADTLDGRLRNEDYYAVSFATNNFREMRLQRAIKPAQINIYTVQNQVFIHQALLDRYQSLTNFFYEKKLLDERSQLSNLLNSKSDVLRIMLDNGESVRVKDVMDTENDKNSLGNALIDYENNFNYNLQKIKQFLKIKNELTIDYQSFITIDSIEQNIKSLQNDAAVLHPNIALRFAQMKYSAAESAYENARDRNVFSYFQAGYDRTAYDAVSLTKFKAVNNIAFRLGLTVPLPSNNNLKRSKAALQQKEDEQNTILTRQLQQKSTDNQLIRIENFLKSYRLNEKSIKESLIQKLLNNPKLMQQTSPMEVLDLKISIKKMQLRSLEIAYQITTEYVRYLDLTGAMSFYPKKNFLK